MVFLPTVAALAGVASAFRPGPVTSRLGSAYKALIPRQLPAEPTDVKTLISPNGFNITYKEPGAEGVCETTLGVNSYSGFINLAPDVHSFFWFFESRSSPSTDPITMWLNGGPGSDSLIGLFEELGPCRVSEDLVAHVNPHAWNEVSNMMFLSQPLGVGFSYSTKGPGSRNPDWGNILNATMAPVDGRYPFIDPERIDTTDLAAAAGWEVVQAFLDALPTLDPSVGQVAMRDFNLATESYGGHYGTSFYNYFYKQNERIASGAIKGTQLNFDTLTIINGIIDEAIQAPYYPEFAMHNTYGLKLYNETIYNYTQIALHMPGGCLDQVEYCRGVNRSTNLGKATCSQASNMCRDNVEGLYYAFGDRGVYDIRHPQDDPTPESYWMDYINQAEIQDALGVDTNYTTTNNADVYYAFSRTGDFVFPVFKEYLEEILGWGVRVSLIYGDADYICNWFGGEALSLATNYSYTDKFNAAGYAPLLVGETEYGAVREYGNFSFVRLYDAGHETPYYQPVASLALFNRTINHVDLATGTKPVTADLGTEGAAKATHTQTAPPLPAATGTSGTQGSVQTPRVRDARDANGRNGVWPVGRDM